MRETHSSRQTVSRHQCLCSLGCTTQHIRQHSTVQTGFASASSKHSPAQASAGTGQRWQACHAWLVCARCRSGTAGSLLCLVTSAGSTASVSEQSGLQALRAASLADLRGRLQPGRLEYAGCGLLSSLHAAATQLARQRLAAGTPSWAQTRLTKVATLSTQAHILRTPLTPTAVRSAR